MITVTTTGGTMTSRQRPKTGSGSLTVKRVIVLVFVTSFVWFLLDLSVIQFYSSQGRNVNTKLPLDDDPTRSKVGDNDPAVTLEPAEKKLRDSFGADNETSGANNADARVPKPKLARLLKKQAAEGYSHNPHSPVKVMTEHSGESGQMSNDTKRANESKEIQADVQKESTTEGFHLVKAVDTTSFPRDPDGPGEKGAVVNSDPEEQKLIEAKWSLNYFNEYVSDKISVERSVPDFRHEDCQKLNISNNLPKTSVIMCFCEESWSTLLRSVHSVLNRSPPELIEEVILIDDFSQREHLKEPLDKYMAGFPKVKVVHLKERHGLVRARLVGVEMSKASVLTFLDSHIECMVGWLEPLLQRVHEDRKNVVSPIIDSIDATTFGMKSHSTHIGSFSWAFTFTWVPMPGHERKRRKHATSPTRTPTMAGGLFSIDKSFFHELGTYDEGFEVWGAENLELSFKTWMCGGQLEILPCSRVGHIFRKKQPYSFPKNDNMGTFRHNTMRMVEVWVDEPYRRVFYNHEPSLVGQDPGNLEGRRAIRQELQCKDFQWYLDNVHPDKEIPEINFKARGTVRSVLHKKVCLDNMGSLTIGAFTCHGLGYSQLFFLTKKDRIINQDYCCGPSDSRYFTRWRCIEYGAGNTFTHERGGPIIEKASGKCLELFITSKGNHVKFEACNDKDSQKWIWEHYDGDSEDKI